jgi:hypothetical protein
MLADAQKMAGLTDAVSSFIAAAWDAGAARQPGGCWADNSLLASVTPG